MKTPDTLKVAPFAPFSQGVGILDSDGKEVARVRHRKGLNCYDTARAIVESYNAGSAETIAFIAIGAQKEINDLKARERDAVFSRAEGFIVLIGMATEHAPLLDRMFQDRADNFGAVFCYEIAEPFGSAYIRALIETDSPNAEEIARAVFADAGEL